MGRFGKIAERADANNEPKILNMIHYVYKWGLFAHSWGSLCRSCGIGETLGQDLLVSLGCGFGEQDFAHAGTEDTWSEQVVTLMRELGHTLNLRLGGPDTTSAQLTMI